MVRRLVNGALAGALALTLAGPVTAAVAGDHHSGPGRVAAAATLTDAQLAAVKAARQTYLETVWPALATYDDAVDAAQSKMSKDLRPQRRAVAVAADATWFAVKHGSAATTERAALDQAVAAYRTAYAVAKEAMRSSVNAAKAQLQSVIDQARQAYVAAVTAAFPAGASIPESVLTPPGKQLLANFLGVPAPAAS